MGTLSEKAAFLKGLAEGLDLKDQTPEQKLIGRMMELLEEMADVIDELSGDHQELSELVGAMEEDLTSLEEVVYDEFDDDEDDDDDDDDDEDTEVTYDCPHCGKEAHFAASDFYSEKSVLCEHCRQQLFPEGDFEEEEEEEDRA